MKNVVATPFKGGARRACAAVVLLLAAAAFASAQQGPPPGAAAPGHVNPKEDTQSRTNREARLRSAEIRPGMAQMNQRQLAAAIEQTRNDFKRIQVVRNDIIDLLVSKRPPDYRRLAEQAGDVNKSAHRLKSFLMKSPAEGEKPADGKKAGGAAPEYDEAGMRAALVKLCNTIHSFTGNPMFKNPDVVDAQQPARAGGDLLAIIELSEGVKLNAERLARASK